METFSAPDIPKFSSPEEEINFLRERIASRERELGGSSIETSKEEIASEAIRDYRSLPKEKILTPSHSMSEEKSDAIVLRLKPENHDSTMEELLAILLEKGIKNALAVVEKLKNPHIDDDFHRFLIQYLISVGKIPDLKESSPIGKSLDMRLFEITLPDSAYEEKTFKDLIAAMEQLYLGLQSIGDGRDNESKNYFMFEIALSSSSDEVVFYAAVPHFKADLFEKQLISFYHDAKVREAPDDYNIFVEGGSSSASYAALSDKPMYPLRTYDTFDHDPMSTILNVFSKLKETGEGAAVQFVIAPCGDKYIKRFNAVLHDLRQGESMKNAGNKYASLGSALGTEAKKFLFGSLSSKEDDEKKKSEDSKKMDEEIPARIAEKIKSTIVTAGIRVVASAESKERASQILGELESAFNQFSNPGSNSLLFRRITDNYMPTLLHSFSYRLLDEDELMPLNVHELTTIFHLPFGITGAPQLKEAKAGIAPAPIEVGKEGVLLGTNSYRGRDTDIRLGREDRMRHFYVIGQTGSGKTVTLKNMIRQDILNGDGCCFIDPHGTDIQDILSFVPPERIDDVIYFDPAYTARPMGLNMLEYDENYPEQKTFVVNELMNIFNKLFDMKVGGGAMFEQYFRNSAFLVMEHPESGSTLLEITRVLADKEFRQMKLSHCKNPIIRQFWEGAEKTTGDQSLANFVPYISSKFDNFISNDIMRPVVLQEKSVFNFRKIMDEKKILLVNLSKGRLGDINANLIGLVLVGKIQMAALSRVDSYGKKLNDFYLYIDEFQNITTDSISSILSEARKYRLSLNIAHQYINQLEENIKDAVFGNVGNMAIFRVSPEDATVLESKVKPVFTAADIIKQDNLNCYMSMLVDGQPVKPFNIHVPFPPRGNVEVVEKLKELSYLKYGRPREEVEEEIIGKYKKEEKI